MLSVFHRKSNTKRINIAPDTVLAISYRHHIKDKYDQHMNHPREKETDEGNCFLPGSRDSWILVYLCTGGTLEPSMKNLIQFSIVYMQTMDKSSVRDQNRASTLLWVMRPSDNAVIRTSFI